MRQQKSENKFKFAGFTRYTGFYLLNEFLKQILLGKESHFKLSVPLEVYLLCPHKCNWDP